MSPTKLAKKAVEKFVKTGEVLNVPESCFEKLSENKKGAFVTLKKNGKLRGCMGTAEPTCESAAEEIISAAISASRDPRLPPLHEKELSKLSYEVYLLDPPELFKKIKPKDNLRKEIKKLNPEKYGIIVKNQEKSALLLPGLEDLNSPLKQVKAALKKSGISPNKEEFKIYKFEAEKYVEK